MRLDQNTLRDIDVWRGRDEELPSRAEAIRKLIELGLKSFEAPTKQPLRLNRGETLLTHMLCDLFKALKIKSEFDPKFIQAALHGGHLWALEWKYHGTFHDHIDAPEAVNEVVDILDMWDFIESGYAELSKKDKDRVESEAAPFGKDPKFFGFDGNNETEHMGVARFLIEDMGRFSRFKGRGDLNSHHPSIETYRRMLRTFLPIRTTLVGTGLSAAQLIEILGEKTHPSRRTGKGGASD